MTADRGDCVLSREQRRRHRTRSIPTSAGAERRVRLARRAPFDGSEHIPPGTLALSRDRSAAPYGCMDVA